MGATHTSLVEYSPENRLKVSIAYAIITLGLSFTLLGLAVILLGESNVRQPPPELNETYQIIITLYTCVPALTGLLFIFGFKTMHWRELGLFLPKNKLWLGFGILYAACVLFLTIILVLAADLGSINFQYNPWYPYQISLGNIMLNLGSYFLIVPFLLLISVGGFVRIIGEEVGWRGYLMPQLLKSAPRISVLYSILIVGGVWTLWHIPFFTFLSPQFLNPLEMTLSFLGSVGVFFGASFAMCWSLLKTHSLWPAVSLHFLWNIINPVLTGNVYSGNQGVIEGSLWLTNGEGLVGSVFHLVVGVICYFLIRKEGESLVSAYLGNLARLREEDRDSWVQTPAKGKDERTGPFYRALRRRR